MTASRPFAALLVLLLAASAVHAQTTASGVIARVTQSDVQLRGGTTHAWASSQRVTLANGSRGAWGDLRADDAVQLTLNAQNRITALTVTGRSVGQREEQSLLNVRPVQGRYYDIVNQATINGRVFERAVETYQQESVIVSNAGGYDLLEALVGVSGAGDPNPASTAVFTVLGDGQEIFRSPPMRSNTPALRISIPIRGYSGITLRADVDLGGSWNRLRALWANPMLVKQAPVIPTVVSPAANARLTRSTPFVWEAVDGATGYLLEMQAVELDDAADAENENRFVALWLPAETTVYTFDAAAMPEGSWRWRVHSLSDTGILGEMTEWREFTSR